MTTHDILDELHRTCRTHGNDPKMRPLIDGAAGLARALLIRDGWKVEAATKQVDYVRREATDANRMEKV